MKRRILSIIIALTLCLSLFPAGAFATETDASLCRHHREHTAECGYLPAGPGDGRPCSHEHTDECYAEKTQCVHTHDESCYSDGRLPAEGEDVTDVSSAEGENATDVPSAEGENATDVPSAGSGDGTADTCVHECSEESGCITKEPDCRHEHNGECGYIPAAENGEGNPCAYDCHICPVEALIAALPAPADITADNRADAEARLAAIDEARAKLTDEEAGELDITRYQDVVSALTALDAQPEANEIMPVSGEPWNIADGSLNIAADGEYTVTGTTSAHTITVAGSNAEITLSGVNITSDGTAFDIQSGTVTLILADGTANRFTSGSEKAGIHVAEGASLTIQGSGTLTAVGGEYGAGIGGNQNGAGGAIAIYGGTVTATGGSYSAGIGGGRFGAGGTIAIHGGTVTATGRSHGAGIGGGESGAGGSITIKNANVTATSGSYGGAGIGGGTNGNGGFITITGSEITATGGSGGAGIGGSDDGDGGVITITNSQITATGGFAGPGIGGGQHGAGGFITITDSTVRAKGQDGAENIGHGNQCTDSGTQVIQSSIVNDITYNTVIFNAGQFSEEVQIPPQVVAANGTATQPTVAVDGYTVEGYYTDQDYTIPFNFDTQITAGTTVYVKVEIKEGAEIARVTIDGTEKNYFRLDSAWASLAGKTGTLTLLKSVETGEILTVSSGMDVTVEMSEGVTFTNSSVDCFQVKGGALRLTKSCTAVERGGGKSIVYAASGTLRVTGGSYTSAGNGFWVDSGVDVEISGGSITVASGSTPLRCQNPRTVREMLPDGCAVSVNGDKLLIRDLSGEKLPASGETTYTVGECGHADGEIPFTDNGDGTHSKSCPYCGLTAGEPAPHEWSGIECTVCGAKYAASVTAGGSTDYFEDFDKAWNTAQRAGSATLRLLTSVEMEYVVEFNSGDVTLEMEDGVVLSTTNEYGIAIFMDGGTLTLNSGTIKGGYGGALQVADGTLIIAGGSVKGACEVNTGAVMEVRDGEICGGDYALMNYGGEVKLSGGSFSVASEDREAIIFYGNPVTDMLVTGYAFCRDGQPLVPEDGAQFIAGSVTVETCKHNVGTKYLGTSVGHTPACAACGTAAGETQAHTGNPCSVCGYAPAVQVRFSDGRSETYGSIREAWKTATAAESATVTLLCDVSNNMPLEMTKGNIILKSNTNEKGEAYTLSTDSTEGFAAIYVAKAGALTVESGTVRGTQNGIYVNDGGAVTITGDASITASGDYSRGVYISGGTASITGDASITASGNGSRGVYISDGTVTIAGDARINAAGTGCSGVYVDWTDGMYISGGTITGSGEGSSGLYVDSDNVTLAGGTFEGDGNAIFIKSGYGPLSSLLGGKGYYYYDVTNEKRIDDAEQLAGLTLSGTVAVRECTHSFGEDGVCTVCGYRPVAEVSAGGATRQYGSLKEAWNAATMAGVPEATITILTNVSYADEESYYELEVNERHSVTLTSGDGASPVEISGYMFGAYGGTLNIENCTIREGRVSIESGEVRFTNCEITGGYCGVGVYGGEATISDSTVTGGYCGVMVVNGGKVTVNSGAVIQATDATGYGGTVGLYISQGTAALRGGTFSGPGAAILIEGPDLTLGDLLGHTDEVRYAYCDEDNKLIAGELESTELAGPVTVKPCAHEKPVSNANGTHTLACTACGYQAVESCSYDFAQDGTAACSDCGSAIAITVAGGALSYDGSEKKPAVTVTVDGAELTSGCTVTYKNNVNAGENTASVTVTGAFSGSFTKSYTINKSQPAIAFAGGYRPGRDYDGRALSRPTAADLDITGVSYDDVTFTWYKDSIGEANKLNAAPRDAGSYILIAGIAATNNTEAAQTGPLTVTISPRKITSPTIELSPGTFEYDGRPKTPVVTVRDGDTVIPSGEYEVSYFNTNGGAGDHTSAGTVTVTIADKPGGNYTVSGSTTFTITGHNLTNAVVSIPGRFTYDGKAKTPEVTVTLNGAVIPSGEYEVSYFNTNGGAGDHTSAGTVTVTVTAKAGGSYGGTATGTFKIAPAVLSVSGAAAADRTYDGTNAVAITGVTLRGIVNGDDVTVRTDGLTGRLNGSDAGRYTAVTLPTLTLTGGAASNYSLTQPAGVVPANVAIRKAAALTPKTGDIAVANGQAYTYTYGLGALRPEVPAGMNLGSIAVTYELSSVHLSGGYYDSSAGSAKVAGQTLTLPVQAVDSDTEGFLGTINIIIHTGNFEDITAAIRVRSVNKTVPTGAPTLSADTLTYGQALGAIALSGSMKDGSTTVPGTFTWSSPDNRPAVQESYAAAWVFTPEDNDTYAIVNGTTEIRVLPASIAGAAIELRPTAFRYDGAVHRPGIAGVTLDGTALTMDVDYTAEIPEGTAAGAYTVTLTGKGNYTGTAAAQFAIHPVEHKPLDRPDGAGHELRLEVETGLSAVPAALIGNAELNTPAKIENALRMKVAEVMSHAAEQIAVFDVALQYKDESGVWRNVDPDDFPAEGVTAILPYPAGTGPTGWTFTVQHLISSGAQAGMTETLPYELTAAGLQCTFRSLSPVAIGYAAEKPDPQPTPGGNHGGSGGSGGTVTYPVTVEKSEHGKVTADRATAASGSTVTLIVTPDSGYALHALTVTDSRGNTVKGTDAHSGKYIFTMPGSAVTVKAVFVPLMGGTQTPCDGGADCPSRGFTDLKSTGAWYHEAVDYVLEHGLMTGYRNGTFGPNDTLSRAQLVQILYNREGKPAVTGASASTGTVTTDAASTGAVTTDAASTGAAFTDVASGAWYADAVIWAAQRGIVSGYSNERFGPDDSITRQQLAVILYQYAGSPAVAGKELSFTDADQAGDYARNALRWAVENGIINGYGDGRLRPQGLATRAQVAQMMMNFLKDK